MMDISSECTPHSTITTNGRVLTEDIGNNANLQKIRTTMTNLKMRMIIVSILCISFFVLFQCQLLPKDRTNCLAHPVPLRRDDNLPQFEPAQVRVMKLEHDGTGNLIIWKQTGLDRLAGTVLTAVLPNIVMMVSNSGREREIKDEEAMRVAIVLTDLGRRRNR